MNDQGTYTNVENSGSSTFQISVTCISVCYCYSTVSTVDMFSFTFSICLPEYLTSTLVCPSFFGPYSIDVMASCAFSVDMDSINNPSGPLITHATKLFRFSKLLFVFQGIL